MKPDSRLDNLEAPLVMPASFVGRRIEKEKAGQEEVRQSPAGSRRTACESQSDARIMFGFFGRGVNAVVASLTGRIFYNASAVSL